MKDTRKIGGTILKVENISVVFGGVKAITNISFEVTKGEICAIIGPNGAGKSSLLNVLNGVYRMEPGGSITFEGVRREKVKPGEGARLGIARTFQNLALFRGLCQRGR